MSRFDCTRSCEHNTLASMLMINHGFVSAKNDQAFTPIQQQQARDNIGAASKADIPDISGLATKAELSNLQLGLTEEQVRAIIEEYHPPKPKDQGLAKDYPGTGWYKATDTGVVYNRGVADWETHTFEGDPIEYISAPNYQIDLETGDGDFETLAKIQENLGRIATSNMTSFLALTFDLSSNENIYNGEDLSHYDTSRVTNMSAAFQELTQARVVGIEKWDTSKVVGMNSTFFSAKAFNQDIGNWDTSSVTDMQDMFNSARAFNQDIGDWNTSKVVQMKRILYAAESFNQDLSSWCVPKIPTRPEDWEGYENIVPPVWGTCPRGEDQA